MGAPRSDFMAQSLLLSLDVCPGLGISPLRTNIWLSYSQAYLGPRSDQELFFSGFLKSLELFFRRFALMARGTDIFWRASLRFQLFMEASRFHCQGHAGSLRIFLSSRRAYAFRQHIHTIARLGNRVRDLQPRSVFRSFRKNGANNQESRVF